MASIENSRYYQIQTKNGRQAKTSALKIVNASKNSANMRARAEGHHEHMQCTHNAHKLILLSIVCTAKILV